MEKLHYVPAEAVSVAMLPSDLNDRRDALIIEIGAKQRVDLISAFPEGDLKKDRILIAVDHCTFVLSPAEGAVDKELGLRRPFLGVAGTS